MWYFRQYSWQHICFSSVYYLVELIDYIMVKFESCHAHDVCFWFQLKLSGCHWIDTKFFSLTSKIGRCWTGLCKLLPSVLHFTVLGGGNAVDPLHLNKSTTDKHWMHLHENHGSLRVNFASSSKSLKLSLVS